MAKRFKRKAKVGVMVRYWIKRELHYGIIASVPNGTFFNHYYKIRDCVTSQEVFVTEANIVIHKA